MEMRILLLLGALVVLHVTRTGSATKETSKWSNIAEYYRFLSGFRPGQDPAWKRNIREFVKPFRKHSPSATTCTCSNTDTSSPSKNNLALLSSSKPIDPPSNANSNKVQPAQDPISSNQESVTTGGEYSLQNKSGTVSNTGNSPPSINDPASSSSSYPSERPSIPKCDENSSATKVHADSISAYSLQNGKHFAGNSGLPQSGGPQYTAESSVPNWDKTKPYISLKTGQSIKSKKNVINRRISKLRQSFGQLFQSGKLLK